MFAPPGSPPSAGARSQSAPGRRVTRRRPPKWGLLIDAMGTLVSLHPPAPLLVAELYRRFGVSIGDDEASRMMTAEIRFYRAHMHEARDDESVRQVRYGCAEAMRSAAVAPGVTKLGGDELVGALLASLRFNAYPDAADALRRARSAGARVIVVSNWDVSLNEVLERVGLAPLLDGVVTSAAVGAGKPAPDIFRHALGLAGVRAAQAVHVGDSLVEDVRGAQACGIRAVLVTRDGARVADDAGVSTVDSLARLTWAQGAGACRRA